VRGKTDVANQALAAQAFRDIQASAGAKRAIQ